MQISCTIPCHNTLPNLKHRAKGFARLSAKAVQHAADMHAAALYRNTEFLEPEMNS